MIDIKELRRLTKAAKKEIEAEVKSEVSRALAEVKFMLGKSARSGSYSEIVLLFDKTAYEAPMEPAIGVRRLREVAEVLHRDLKGMGLSVTTDCAGGLAEITLSWGE